MFSIQFLPNVYSAASLDGANFTFGIILGKKINILCKKTDIFDPDDALLDLIAKTFAPPDLAASKSIVDKECSFTRIT